jgi:tetratricopeptide (TPR) repeat protein
MTNLGAIALTQGEPIIARSSFHEALEMLEAALGPDHPGLIGPLNNLGVAEQALGDYPAARALLERAAALQAKHLPATHLRVAETERNLARNALLSASPDARDHIVRATRIGLDLLDRLIREGSENERLNFLERFDLVSLPCATGDAELIADVLIATKARLLDAMLAGSVPATRPTWRDVQAALPPGSAFIDTCRFTTTAVPQTKRYGAIVILPAGPPKWVPLGTDESLERWLGAFHDRIRWRSGALAGNPGSPPPLKIRGILRSIDWYRRRGALKNQPNTGDSLNALTDNPEHGIQFEDRSADPQNNTFERIYKECQEALTAAEWELVFILFVTQSATIQDLIGDAAFCAKFGIKAGVSLSTRRRVLSELVEAALEKLRKNLIN